MDKTRSKEVWGAAPAGSIFAKRLRPGTREFFEETIKARNTQEIPLVLELIPFSQSRNKKVLELGCGAGYDAYEFCRNGADYVGIDITPENIERTKEHLGYYGYSPAVMEGDAENLQFENESFDIVFSNGVLHHTPDIDKSFAEARRVLRHGGELWVILYHKNSLFYWISLLLVEHILRLGFIRRSFKERLSMIEYTTSKELPLVNVYSRAELKKLLARVGFSAASFWIRKLAKEDLPPLPLIGRLWKFIPQRWLNAIGKCFGWYVIAKAVKR